MTDLSLEERIIRATEFGSILPSQFMRKPGKQAPEEQLMIAILHDAIDCIEKYRFATDTRRQRLFQEAKAWLLADESAWPYSFESICAVIELDATAVRERLRLTAMQQTSPTETPELYYQEPNSQRLQMRGHPTTDPERQTARE